MSRRDQIKMTPDEVDDFLRNHRTVQIATINADGTPHLVAMWYGLIDGRIVFWTYEKSQKVRNLRRNPAMAAMVEAGQSYGELRGVSITGVGEVSAEPEYVMSVGEAVLVQSGGGGVVDGAARESLRQSAAKRVAVTVRPSKLASWDHAKLGGGY